MARAGKRSGVVDQLSRRAWPRRERATRRSGQRGQALVELALVAPILLLLLMGLVQFAIIYERQIGITNAVREAARRAATWDTPDGATAVGNAAAALTLVQTLLGNSQTHDGSRDKLEVCYFTPAAYPVDASGNGQVMVRIREDYRHPLFLPIITQILDGIDGVIDDSLLASTQSEFHVEQSGSFNIGAGAFARSPAGDSTACQR
jgi:Flp pilus assembly protein TadG